MKTFKSLFLAVVMLFSFQSMAANTTNNPSEQGNHLIVYYSLLGGNTKTIAEYVQQAVGGDMVEIRTVQSYPGEFNAVVAQARRERENNILPPIRPLNVDFDKYDVIYLGFPIWSSTLAQPVATFLSQNNLAGKTIVPFITHDGYGIGRSLQAIRQYAPDATLLEHFAIVGSEARNGQQQVAQWLAKLPTPAPVNAAANTATTPVIVTIGDIELEGYLNDSAESRQFIRMMPITVSMVRFGGREYYGGIQGRISLTREGQFHFENGDITYSPRNNTVAIFYAQTDRPNLTMPIVPLGKVTSDLAIFDNLGRSADVSFRLKQ